MYNSYMENLYFALLAAGITWAVLYFGFYGHRAVIRKLWKEIFEYARVTDKYNNMKGGVDFVIEPAIRELNAKSNKAGRVINALLDYHYGETENEEEKGYIHQHRYELKN